MLLIRVFGIIDEVNDMYVYSELNVLRSTLSSEGDKGVLFTVGFRSVCLYTLINTKLWTIFENSDGIYRNLQDKLRVR